jgi:hypothetical protein
VTKQWISRNKKKDSIIIKISSRLKPLTILIILLVCCSCSGNQKKTSTKDKTGEKTSQNWDAETVSEPEELKIHVSKYRILPIDESSEDRSLNQFVSKLKDIVKRKDLSRLIACLDTGIVLSYGGGMQGIEIFLEEWKLNTHPERSELWPKMRHFLILGGAWDTDKKDEFNFPYAQSDRFFEKIDFDFDWYVTAVCISKQTVVYQEPLTNAKKIALLSYEIVKIINRGDSFIEVQTIDKTISGFVKKEQIILSADSYPVLQKVNGEWKIISFAPYD